MAKIINKGITKDIGIWKNFPEKVGKLLTIAIEINPIKSQLYQMILNRENSLIAIGNNIKSCSRRRNSVKSF